MMRKFKITKQLWLIVKYKNKETYIWPEQHKLWEQAYFVKGTAVLQNLFFSFPTLNTHGLPLRAREIKLYPLIFDFYPSSLKKKNKNLI